MYTRNENQNIIDLLYFFILVYTIVHAGKGQTKS